VGAARLCTPAELAASVAWPPCDAANWRLSTPETLVLAALSLGIVYGAFAANVIFGALRAVPAGSLDAARAMGLRPRQVLWLVHLPQMWSYALPGLANVWLLLLKATALLSLLQIVDIVAWAQRLGAANYSSFAGLVHGDWRWGYFLALLALYLVATWLSGRAFAALARRARHGLPEAAP
jgi:polar amino acid transport system permease protein